MSNLLATRIINIVSFTLGSVQIFGIRELSYDIDQGVWIPKLVEGQLYPTDVELVGNANQPVTGKAIYETSHTNVATAQASAKADAVVVWKVEKGGSNQQRTLKNFQFGKLGGQQQLQKPAMPGLDWFAVSTDGITLPYVDA